MSKTTNPKWIILDLLLAVIFILLVLSGTIYNNSQLKGSMFFFFIAVIFIFSKYLKERSFTFTMTYWVAENIFKPKTNYNNIIWGIFFFFIGIAMVLSKPLDSWEIQHYRILHNSYTFWIVIAGVLIFNIIVGIITSKRRK